MAIDIASLIPSLVGLGTKIGTAIPGLKKPPKVKAPMQATRLGGQVLGAAQSGHGASRGLALREGLRQAGQAVANVAGVEAQAQLAAERQNQAALQTRNANIASFGGDLAKGLGDMAALGITPKKQSSLQDPERAPVEVNTQTGFGTPQDEADVGSQSLDDIEAGVADQERLEQDMLMNDAQTQLDAFRQKREAAGMPSPEAAFKPEPTAMLLEALPPKRAPLIEKELERSLIAKRLMLAEMERQGLSFEEMLPRINRRLRLQPGQTLENPLALTGEEGLG